MTIDGLFPDLATTEPVAAPARHAGAARVAAQHLRRADGRTRAGDHRMRPLVAFVGKLELGPLYRAINAEVAERVMIDPDPAA